MPNIPQPSDQKLIKNADDAKGPEETTADEQTYSEISRETIAG